MWSIEEKMEIIKKIKKIMEEQGMSQEKAAREIGVSSNTVFRWIHGKNNPSDLGLLQIYKFIKKYEPQNNSLNPIDNRKS